MVGQAILKGVVLENGFPGNIFLESIGIWYDGKDTLFWNYLPITKERRWYVLIQPVGSIDVRVR